MADDIDDSFIPGVQLEPLKGFEDLADVLDPATGRMYGAHGVKGMTIEEAAKHAEGWWEAHRAAMPDYGKSDDYLNSFGTKSGIMLGLPWARLNRGERIRVVKIWHQEIGIPKHGMGFNPQTKGENEYAQFLKDEQRRERIRSFDLPRIFGADNAETRH